MSVSMFLAHTLTQVLNFDPAVSSLTTGPRVEEAMWRTIRWLDRCIEAHEKSGRADTQNLFAIVQGGLDPKLRDQCLDEMVARKDRVAGYAIGGLSGGEEKGRAYPTTGHNLNLPQTF